MKIIMSKQEARKITIIEELLTERFTNKQAAELLDLSVRQIQRLKAEATANGVISVLHKSRGRKPFNALSNETAEEIYQIYKTELFGYNFCHATDVLAEEKNIFVSTSTVSRYLKKNGICSPKAKRRPKKHRSRDAREHEGEMAQMDASGFDWLSDGSYLQLHGAVDDATGRILALHLEEEETFDGYSELMFQMNHDGHLPRELYTDGRTVFVYNSKKKKKLTIEEELLGKTEKQPHFARALKELNILLIIAKSAQAKGCIERLWETLQDRLPKDMQRKGISSIEQANEFLKSYIPYYNRKFSVLAASPEKVYLPKQDMFEMKLMFSKHHVRKLNSGLSFSFEGNKYRMPIYTSGQKIFAYPRDLITVATSKHIGIQVLFKDLVIEPEKLITQQKIYESQISDEKSLSKTEQPDKPQKPQNHNSPWYGYSKIFYSKRKRGVT